MSKEGNPNPNNGGNDGGTPPVSGFTPITSQDDLNRVIAARLERERAKYADYDQVKAKAARFDELEEAQKAAEAKAAEAKAAVEAERDKAKAEALRWRIAAKHGISDEDTELFLTGSDEDTLTKQAERLAARSGDQKKRANHAPREGGNPTPPTDDKRAAVRALFGGDV